MEKPHLEDLHGLPINDPWKMISTNCAEWPNLLAEMVVFSLHQNGNLVGYIGVCHIYICIIIYIYTYIYT